MRRPQTCAWILLLTMASVVNAYDPESHRQITQRSAQADVSLLNKVLMTQLGLQGGIGESLPGTIMGRPRLISDLLGDGAAAEDSPDIRVLNHFHNPLWSWENAGLRVFCVQLGQSAVLWQQSAAQGMGGQWAWQDARVKYLSALKAASKEQRDQAFAMMFETLGHAVHLLQDITVPAHVRNDQHLLYESYEKWVQREREVTGSVLSLDNTNPAGHKPTIEFTATGNSRASVPVARLMDADVFSGTNVDVLAGTGVGLAEYTNGNFFSGDTVCKDFTFPRCPQSPLVPRVADTGTGAKRLYYPKQNGGEPIDHFVAEGTFLQKVINRGQLDGAPAFVLDDRVYQDYAAKLIPRAVGYSAALLDYFFRGKLNFTVEPGQDVQGNDDPLTRRLTVTNRSTETMNGQFFLYGDTEDGTRKPFPVMTDGQDTFVLAAGEQSPRISFVVPEEFRNVSAQGYAVVFQGKLGSEEGAVAGAVNPVAAVFAIQETAGFSTDAEQTVIGPQETVSQYSRQIDQAWRIQGDPTRQRATGRFETGSIQSPGKFIKAVRLQLQPPPDPGGNQVRLRLEDPLHSMRENETEWIRGANDAFEPVRWTIDVDLSAVGLYGPSVACGPGLAYTCASVRLPRAIEVEMLDGTRVPTPLVWWHAGSENADTQAACSVWPDVVCSDANRSSRWVASRGQAVRVFYGDGDPGGEDYRWVRCDSTYYSGYCQTPYPMDDPLFPHTSVGFAPIGTFGGLGVGTAADEAHITPGNPYPDNNEDPWWSSHLCSGSWTKSRARVFVTYTGYLGEEKKWDKNWASITQENGENVVTRQTEGPPACVVPPLPTTGALGLGDLLIKRDYLPQELTAFQVLGITPPPHTITLKARMNSTP